MEEVRRQGEQVVVSVSLEELRLLGATINEALNGAYAIPEDEWEDLVNQPRERVRAVLSELASLIDR